jgi:hypothetical protein
MIKNGDASIAESGSGLKKLANNGEAKMIKTQGVVHFSLPVTDLERSTKFYSELLG